MVNPYLKKMMARTGADNPIDAVAAFVGTFRKSSDSLRDVAFRLGIDRVVEEGLPYDGGIFESNGSLTVKLNSFAAPVRRRFTLAHEIGHLMIAKDLSAAKGCTSSSKLERACDAIAAELLMPADATRATARELKNSSPANLVRIAQWFGVSYYTAALRLHRDLLLWKRKIGFWECDGHPLELWFVGKRPWSTVSPEFAAFDQARSSSEVVREYDSFRSGDSTCPVSLELLNLGGHKVLGLVGSVA